MPGYSTYNQWRILPLPTPPSLFGCFIRLLAAMSVTFYVKAFVAVALPIYTLWSLIRDRFVKSALNNIPGPSSESFFTGEVQLHRVVFGFLELRHRCS